MIDEVLQKTKEKIANKVKSLSVWIPAVFFLTEFCPSSLLFGRFDCKDVASISENV